MTGRDASPAMALAMKSFGVDVDIELPNFQGPGSLVIKETGVRS